MKIILCGAIIFCFGANSSLAQDSTFVDSSQVVDTILYFPKKFESSTLSVTDSVDYETRLDQNPTVALFKSMLVPGLGQIGNRKYIKAGIVIGLETWLVTSAVKHGGDASELRDQFNQSTDITERNALYSRYLDSKDQRNKFTWFAIIVTFVSMFDAYSDAHLSGFPKEKDNAENNLELNFRPSGEHGLYAAVSYSF